jgi:hypothetical protein
MTVVDRVREASAPPLPEHDREMARVSQRCIISALDHSGAVAITLTTDTDEHPTVDVPPAALKLIGQLLGALMRRKPGKRLNFWTCPEPS